MPGAGVGQIGARLAQGAIGKVRQRNAEPDPWEERDSPSGDSAQPTAKEAIGDVASAALSGAVQGAVGGAAGAAAGAAKGAAFAALGNKRIRTAIISAIVVVLFVIVFAFTAPLLTVGALLSAYQPGEDGATTKSAEESGATYQEVNAARDGQDRYGLPWYLVLALTQADKSVNLQAVADKLAVEDHSREWRDLRIGGLHYSDRGYLTIPTDKSSRDYQNAQHVRDLHIPAIEAAGFSEQQANKIYAQALSWALGEDQCTADGGTGANPSPIGDDAQIGGETWNGKQVANMKTIIGMAKTMYPASARQAAVIALITARVESSFQNYANDGIITDDDGHLSASEAADYEKLKFSLTLNHDKVGSDHASVGVFQQQALFSWGDIPGSTWKTDYQGVLRRLLDPAFAAFKFLERVRDTSGWESMDPGSVAQAVQVSAKPDRYAQRVPLAEAIWTAYGDSSPALPLPDGTSWSGPGDNGDGNGDGRMSAACNEGTPEGTVPAASQQQLAQQILAYADEGKIIWFASAPEGYDQIAAYAAGGKISDACTLDVRVLQVIVMAAQMFDKISINSLNRRCTSSHAGTGEASYHWKGQAADIGDLNGKSTAGDPAIPEAHTFWARFAQVAADSGGGLGQLECRGGQEYPGVANFYDSCDHIHFEVGRDGNTNPLKG
ncbi:hypothetical protein [Microbacterium xylanilyticum]